MVIASTQGESPALTPGEHRQFYLQMLAMNRASVDTVVEEIGPHSGAWHVMAFAPLSVTHWGIAVGGTEAETFAPVRQLQNYIFILGTISFGVIFLATLWGARLLVRPVKVLTSAAEQIAAGNLNNAIELNEGGEIGTLAEAFEAMRVRLKQSLTEITAWSNELETRVRERTQELETVNAELQDEEKERQKLLERVIDAQEEERKRVARELHDETGQALTALLMSLEGLETQLTEISPPLRERLARTKTLTENALRGLRAIIYDLRPAALDDLGLIPAIRWFADQRLEPLGVQVSVETLARQPRLPSTAETVLFRVMQEAVNNVARHANARNVRIAFEANGEGIFARVEDDGQGFDLTEPRAGWGLVGMRERANLIGGRLQVNSGPGIGTRIEIWIPLDERSSSDG
jgi:signal transduction histidine kinase